MTRTGDFKEAVTMRSYQASSASNFAANPRLNRASNPPDVASGFSTAVALAEVVSRTGSLRWALRNRAQKSGTTVTATKYDANSASTTASASAENRNRLTP